METIIDSMRLRTALNKAIKVVPQKPVVAVMADVRLETKSGHLIITTSNLQSEYMTAVRLDMWDNDERVFRTDATKLWGVFSQMEPQAVRMTLKDDGTLLIQTSTGKYLLPTTDGSDFPVMQRIDANDEQRITVSVKTLTDTLKSSLFACSVNDTLRPVLDGINLSIANDRLRTCSTNTILMAVNTVDVSSFSASYGLTIPTSICSLIAWCLSGADGDVAMSYDTKTMTMKAGNERLTSRLVDGKFPNYMVVIPPSHDVEVEVAKQELVRALKAIRVLAKKECPYVRLTIEGSELRLSTRDIDYQTEAEEKLMVTHEGKDFAITTNMSMLMNAVMNMTGDDLLIRFSGKARPIVIVNKDNEWQLHIVVPMMDRD